MERLGKLSIAIADANGWLHPNSRIGTSFTAHRIRALRGAMLDTFVAEYGKNSRFEPVMFTQSDVALFSGGIVAWQSADTLVSDADNVEGLSGSAAFNVATGELIALPSTGVSRAFSVLELSSAGINSDQAIPSLYLLPTVAGYQRVHGSRLLWFCGIALQSSQYFARACEFLKEFQGVSQEIPQAEP